MKTRAKIALTTLSAIAVSFVCGCFPEQTPQMQQITGSGYILGTTYSLVTFEYFDQKPDVEAKANKLKEDVSNLTKQVEQSLSTAVENSSVSVFNKAAAGETVEIDEMTYTVLSIAKDMYEFTEGYYNPAVYYSVDLYGFAPRETDEIKTYDRVTEDGKYTALILPDEKYVTAFKELATHFADVTFEQKDGKYYATKPQNGYVAIEETVNGEQVQTTYNLKIDLGGIGKGYVADVVNQMMDEAGFSMGSFSFGSSSLAVNKFWKEEDPNFTLGLTPPRERDYFDAGDYYLALKVSDTCISSSGDYEKYYEIDGVRYSHLLNPFTGAPIQTGIMSTTVVGGTAAQGDALTTALCAMDINKAIAFVNENLSDYTVTFAYDAGGEYHVITNASDYLLKNKNYTVKSTVDNNGKIVYNG